MSAPRALITGASSGIGQALALRFQRGGYRLALVARRAAEVTAWAQAQGWDAANWAVYAADVRDTAAIVAAGQACIAAQGVPDVVVANAGLSEPGRSIDLDIARVRTVIDTNFTGAYLTAREGARRMIAAGSKHSGAGRVVLIGSITSMMTGQGDAAYAATKAAIAHLGRQFAREWVRQGINVNVIHPGYIRTEIDGEWFDSEGGAKQVASWPRRRMTEITALDDLMLFFASDASAQVTGTDIAVDDGQSL